MTSHLEALAENDTKRSLFTPLAEAAEHLLRDLVALGRRCVDPRWKFKEDVLTRKVDVFVIDRFHQYIAAAEIIRMLHSVREFLDSETVLTDLLVKCVRDRPPAEALRKLRSYTSFGAAEARLIYEVIVEMSRPSGVTGDTIVR